MNNAVGRLAYALDASREEQGLCPHMKNPAFDAGMVFCAFERTGFPDGCTMYAIIKNMQKLYDTTKGAE